MHSDNMYWSPADLDSEESSQPIEPYIDPWDLENYIYIRENLDYLDLNSKKSSLNFVNEELAASSSNSFHYIPGHGRIQYTSSRKDYESITSEHGNYAAIDESKEYDRKTTELYTMSRRRILNEYESDFAVSDAKEAYSYEGQTSRRNSLFGIYDERGLFRKVSLPLPITYAKEKFPYGESECSTYDSINYHDGRNKATIQRRNSLVYFEGSFKKNTYGRENFRLSQQGHLKIDYSCNWNNLKKLMKDK